MVTLLSRKERSNENSCRKNGERETQASEINGGNLADRSWTPWPRAHSPVQLSNAIDHSKSFAIPPPPLLIARNTFTPLIDARKTGHSIFQRESGHVEIEMIRDVLKGSAKASENREGRGCRERARAEIVPR